MFDAVPNSSASIFAAREIWSLGGRMSEIMLVPFLRRERKQEALGDSSTGVHGHTQDLCRRWKTHPRAASSDRTSFLIFQISMLASSLRFASTSSSSPPPPPIATTG